MVCKNCNFENPDTAKFCNYCAEKLVLQGNSCPNPECKRSGLPDDALFCPDCGFVLSEFRKIPVGKTRKKVNWAIIIAGFALLGIIVFAIIANQYQSTKSAEGNSSLVSESNTSTNLNPVSDKLLPGKYSFASERYLTSEDLKSMSKYELKIMRNEIYARHGFVFRTTSMKEYFENQSWYRNVSKLSNNDEVVDYLSEIEKSNVNMIKSYE